jgi:antitoxin PrlF
MNEEQKNCCAKDGEACSCNVESIISIDERGQMIIPKELREKAGFQPGDKLAVISWSKDGNICSLSVMKTEVLAGYIQDFIKPMSFSGNRE